MNVRPLGIDYCFINYTGFVVGSLISNMHHCGKRGVMDPWFHLYPWSEILRVVVPGRQGLIDIHEGHHNYVHANFGVLGIADALFGTLRQKKNWKKNNS